MARQQSCAESREARAAPSTLVRALIALFASIPGELRVDREACCHEPYLAEPRPIILLGAGGFVERNIACLWEEFVRPA